GRVLVRFRIGRDLHVAVESEQLADRHLHVGKTGDLLRCGGHECSLRSSPFRSVECKIRFGILNLADALGAAKIVEPANLAKFKMGIETAAPTGPPPRRLNESRWT